MHATYKNALMWTLYGAFFLLLTVLQTVVFGRARFFDVKLSILPVCIACVAMLCGAETDASAQLSSVGNLSVSCKTSGNAAPTGR